MKRSLLLLSSLFAVHCSGSEPLPCIPDCSTGAQCMDGVCVTPEDAGLGDGGSTDAVIASNDASTDASTDAGAALQLTLTPTSAALRSVDGSQPTLQYVVTANYDDGRSETVVDAQFSVEPPELGSFNSGEFTASGRVGGRGLVTASWDGFAAQAQLRIELEQTVLIGGTSTTVPPLFELPGIDDPTRSADIVYPLDGAVMPQNVPPADIQWMRSATGDAFRITLIKPNVTVRAFYAQDTGGAFTKSWKVELDAWRRIAQTEPTDTAMIRVDRYEAATQEVIVGKEVSVRFARAALLGSIYYWDIARGRIVRIVDGRDQREEFLPNPPLGCVGCHSVSNSGRWMAGRFGGGENVGGVMDLTEDLTGSPPPTTFPVTSTTTRWWFSDWNPDDTRMIVSTNEQGNAGVELMDPFTGEFIQPAQGSLPLGRTTHPDWSPDGTAIAYVGNTDQWGGANTRGDLFVLPVTGPDSFGEPTRIFTGTTSLGLPAGGASSYPSWTPDTRRLAFALGTSSRSENGQAALYMIDKDGANPIRLTKAIGDENTTDAFQPRFSPFAEDGYFWLTYLSRRDYGNAEAGTLGARRQQLWVTAIKINAAPGEDPSEVSYWLPGQDTASANISAFWAPRACREDTESCGVDAECCGGVCDNEICTTETECREIGETCVDTAQCCGDALCIGQTCGGI